MEVFNHPTHLVLHIVDVDEIVNVHIYKFPDSIVWRSKPKLGTRFAVQDQQCAPLCIVFGKQPPCKYFGFINLIEMIFNSQQAIIRANVFRIVSRGNLVAVHIDGFSGDTR